MTDHERAPAWVSDPSTPSVARMYDYYLGGKDNFAADRAAADRVVAAMPNVLRFTRANREFLARAVRLLAGQGIRQFLDIGSGLPTQENTHEVAQRAAPECRVVYVDNDPVVLTHARALLTGNPRTRVVQGDLRDPKGILDHREVNAHIDFSQPVAILLLAILHFIPGDEDTATIVRTLKERMVSGSHLVLSHGHAGQVSKEVEEQVRNAYGKTKAGDIIPRPHEKVITYFDGMELLGPGLVPVEAWHADAAPSEHDLTQAGFLGGVARKP